MKTDHNITRSTHPFIIHSTNNTESLYMSDMGPRPLCLEEVMDMKLSHQSNVVVSMKEIVIYGVLQIVSYDPYSMK